MPQDMVELQSMEMNSEMGRKACLDVRLHPISFLRKWVSELTGRECQGTPLSTPDGKFYASLSEETLLFVLDFSIFSVVQRRRSRRMAWIQMAINQRTE